MSYKYKIGDIIEDSSSYLYGRVYIIVEKDKAVYVPYFNNYSNPIEPLNEETLILYKRFVREYLKYCLEDLGDCKNNNNIILDGNCYCIHPKEIETECYTPRVLGNIEDLILKIKSELQKGE